MRNGGCDALAPAGYLGPSDEVYARWEKAGDMLSPDDVIDDMRRVLASEQRVARANAGFAKAAGVKLINYEGGQHIQPKDQQETPYNRALGAAQVHPRMYDLYRDHMDMLAAEGVDLFCAYASVGEQGSRHGSWGHLEYYGQDPAEAPKYRAIRDANVAKA